MGLGNSFNLGGRSLKHKLLIAFSLTSIIPILIMTYFVTNFVFPNASQEIFQVTSIILLALWVAWTGYILAKNIILPVISLAVETKIIAEGKYDSKLLVGRDDELGDIADAVNTMTGKMRSYVGELQKYSKETSALNVKIHKKVLTLTNLMKLGEMISLGHPFEDVTNLAAEKISEELFHGFCMIFLKEKTGEYELKSFCNNGTKEVSVAFMATQLAAHEDHFLVKDYLILTEISETESVQKEIRDTLGEDVNVIFFPITIRSNIIGVIVLGNFQKKVEFAEEDAEVLKAFEKELILGYQSSKVMEKTKGVGDIDDLTGFYTFGYLRDKLADEINRSLYYQRPCALIMINVDDYENYLERFGSQKGEQAIKQIALLLSGEVPTVGTIVRSDKDEFGVLLPEMNKREGLDLAERIRRKIETLKVLSEARSNVTVSIGVGENPIDGANADEIITRARQYTEKAKSEGKNKVVVNWKKCLGKYLISSMIRSIQL